MTQTESREAFLSAVFRDFPPHATVLEIVRDEPPGIAYELATLAKGMRPDLRWLSSPIEELFAAPDIGQARWDRIVVHASQPLPADTFRVLPGLCAPGAEVRLLVTSVGSAAALEHLICGEPASGLHPLAPAWTFPGLARVLLDAGLLPDLIHQQFTVPDETLLGALMAVAQSRGMPEDIALTRLGASELIVSAQPNSPLVPHQQGDLAGEEARFTVVTPVSRRWQFNGNVLVSPGLAEVGANVVPVEGASSAAEAFYAGAAQAEHEWILYCHQDVYFPSGSGHAINAWIRQANPQQHPVAGFAGISAHPNGQARQLSGLCLDGVRLHDHPTSHAAVSVDECAVLIHRAQAPKIAPELGWHLWATDLCLQLAGGQSSVCVLRIPVHHNSWGSRTLPPEHASSARTLLSRHPGVRPIRSLCGTLGETA